MAYILGVSRQLQQRFCFEDWVSEDNPVRFVDAFVEKLELDKLGFVMAPPKKCEGRPSFALQVFLKLYLYGYLNGIRSSRRLERECGRNMELQWLLNGLVPNYHSIADFRKVNPEAFQATFKLFVGFLRHSDLVSGEVIAIDGTKIRASNSKKNNFSAKKLDRLQEYTDTRLQDFFSALAQNDKSDENQEEIDNIKAKIKRLKERKLVYNKLQSQLDDSDDPQVSTTDKDARALLFHGQVVEVGYNVQAAVDARFKLVIGTHTINRNDRNEMTYMAQESLTNLASNSFTALLDKGYHTGKELEKTQLLGVKTVVAMPLVINSNLKGTTPDYLVTKFTYNKETNTYTCPQNKILTTSGTWHTKKRGKYTHLFQKYRTPACKDCAFKGLCTGRKKGGREIERSEYAEAVEQNRMNFEANKDLYKQRQEINEHIFGTLKRFLGFYYTNLRGLEKVNGEMSLIMTVYNMKRVQNIFKFEDLMDKLATWVPNYTLAQKNVEMRLHYLRFLALKIYPLAQVA
jgi:transposase